MLPCLFSSSCSHEVIVMLLVWDNNPHVLCKMLFTTKFLIWILRYLNTADLSNVNRIDCCYSNNCTWRLDIKEIAGKVATALNCFVNMNRAKISLMGRDCMLCAAACRNPFPASLSKYCYSQELKYFLQPLLLQIGVTLADMCYLCTSTAYRFNYAHVVIFLQLICQWEENKINGCIFSHLGSLVLLSTWFLSSAL